MNDEKERNDRIDKLIRMLTQNGTRFKNKDLTALLDDERCHNKYQTEEDYRHEQSEWLEKVKARKRRSGNR